MLFPEKLSYVELIFDRKDEKKVLKAVGCFGYFHPDERFRGFKEEELSRTVRLTVLVKELADTLNVNLEEKQEGADSLEEVEELVEPVVKKVELLKQLKREAYGKKRLFLAAREVETALKEISLGVLSEKLSFVNFLAGFMPEDNLEKFLLTAKAESLFSVYSRVSGGSYAFALFFPEGTISESFMVPFSANIVPREAFSRRFMRELRELEEKLEKLRNELINRYGETLKKAYRKLLYLQAILGLETYVTEEGNRLCLRGWIPEGQKKELVNSLRFPGVEVRFGPPGKNPPTLLKTPGFLKPIEEVVTGYSYPSYYDINPVVPFLLTFLLFFGVMFGDIGHGILLSLFGLYVEKRRTVVGRLLTLAGLSSTLFGFLYGSAFGREIFKPVLFSPMEDVEKLLLFSLIVGIVSVSSGMVINLMVKARRKEGVNLLLGEGGLLSLLMYWFAVGVAVKILVFKVSTKFDLLILLFLLTASFLFTFYRTKQLGSSVVESLRSFLENLVNTLSFMRLGAFALAHGALFFSVFTIADLLGKLKGGSILYWLFLISGNLIVVMLESLIVTVQALRLNYYEFFSKFFVGNGRPFKPIKLEDSCEEPLQANTPSTHPFRGLRRR